MIAQSAKKSQYDVIIIGGAIMGGHRF